MTKSAKWVVGGIALLVLIRLMAVLNPDATAHYATPSSATATAAPSPSEAVQPDTATPTVYVSAQTLFDDYHANEVAADAKYKGQRMVVTGTIDGIRKSFTDDIVVTLATSNRFEDVQARGVPAQIAINLAKGQDVALTCLGDGMIIGTPELSECTTQ